MQLNITGQKMDITPPLRSYVTEKIARIGRHFDHVIKTHVVLHVEKTRQMAEATLTTRGQSVRAKAESDNMYAAIDALVDKLDRQVIKLKEKNTDHHQQGGALKDQPIN